MLQRLFPRGSRRRRLLRRLVGLDAPPPAHLAARIRSIPGVSRDVNLDQPDAMDDFEGRLEFARRHVIPWLDRARSLDGAQILEIGCGTGASTVAMSEQGARVTAVDVEEGSIGKARARFAEAGLEAEFHLANATEAAERFASRRFDFIIFYAVMEHMTHPERLKAIRDTWNMLQPGCHWVITGTPNRLWWFDEHTAYLPFYFWLPDDLAFDYARFSKRTRFREIYNDPTPERMFHFLRRGRGVSFHEFDLAIRPSEKLDVVGSLSLDIRATGLLNRLRWKFHDDVRFERFLRRAHPGLHPGFFTKNLNLIIRKD